MMNKLEKFIPLGMNIRLELSKYTSVLFIATIYSLTFLYSFWLEKSDLYYDGQNLQLLEGAIMPDFVDILNLSLFGYVVVIFAMLIMIFRYYLYHHTGTRSVYLMRRLPNKSEYHKRCLAMPIFVAILSIVLAYIFLLIYYQYYMHNTPPQCLSPNQWEKIWSVIL